MSDSIRYFVNYSKVLKYPRWVAKHIFSWLYPVTVFIWKLPKIKTIEETIMALHEGQTSIIRYGDGEMLYIAKKRSLPFQEYDPQLASMLAEVLRSNEKDILVGLPDAYRCVDDFEPELKVFWRSLVTYTYPRVASLLDHRKQYYNANITRLYFGYQDKARSSYHFELMKGLWKDRDILLIEGEKSRLGVANDLFASARSVKRVLGPAHNAFRQFENLLAAARTYSKDHLVLIAMGPTAKVLSYTLALQGYKAIDIGNLDLEYEWYRRGVKDRIVVPGKYTNEVKGGRDVQDVTDPVYLSQIKAAYLN